MTEDQRKRWRQEAFNSLVRVLASAVGAGLVAVISYFALPFMQALAALPDTLEQLDDRLANIEERTASLEGGDRVIRQSSDFSYVEEPVYQGQPITWHLFLARTDLGLPCEYVGGTSLFTGERRVTFQGPALPPIQQVGREIEELRLEIMPPQQLRSSRISLEAQLTYRCPADNGQYRTVHERTDPTFYLLLPGPRPAP